MGVGAARDPGIASQVPLLARERHIKSRAKRTTSTERPSGHQLAEGVMSDVLYESKIEGLRLAFRGKVRDVYDLGDALMIVTSDRLSAFDVVLPTPIPEKGRVLSSLSRFWFERTRHLVDNHLLDRGLEAVVPAAWVERLRGRTQIVRKAKSLPVEAVVRNISRQAGRYKRSGSVCGQALPAGLRQADRLPEVIFTPSTKAPQGEHDQNIDFAQAEQLLGADVAARVRDLSLQIYRFGASWAEKRGIIIADTKFEFGVFDDKIIHRRGDDSGLVALLAAERVAGVPPSFDKQYVRDC
jgi:phosphoribosylaminoimidazole-succinocarboxamide synthase